MTILTRNLYQRNDGDSTVMATLDEQSRVCIGETRNPEHAAEGQIDWLHVVMTLQDAIAFANAVLAAAEDAHYAELARQQEELTDGRLFMQDCKLETAEVLSGW